VNNSHCNHQHINNQRAAAAQDGCPASIQGHGQPAHRPRQGVARASNPLGAPGHSAHPEAARRGRPVQEAPCLFSWLIYPLPVNSNDPNPRTPRTSSPWSKPRRWPVA
jgi:hypothetical protein